MTRAYAIVGGVETFSATSRDLLDPVPTPDFMLSGGFDHLIERVSMHFDGAGVVVLDDEAARAFQVPAGLAKKGWAKVRRDDGKTVHLCLKDDPEMGHAADQDQPLKYRQYPLITKNPMDTAGSLALWHELTGQAWFGTPGSAGTDLLEAEVKAIDFGTGVRGANFKPRVIGPEENAEETDYRIEHWSREPETPGDVDKYDSNRMYLGAAGNVLLCPWTLKRTGVIPFDAKLAGWWLIDVPAWNVANLPDPAGYGNKITRRWVTTPTAALLAEVADKGLSAGFEVLDSWTGNGKRLLKPWADCLERTYQKAAEAGDGFDGERVRAAVKRAYKASIGLLKQNERTFSMYRPDWHYSVIAMARANLWRRIYKASLTGRFPLRVATDEVVYEAATGPPEGFVIGDGLGQFKVKRVGA